jgi:hypothetical protein
VVETVRGSSSDSWPSEQRGERDTFVTIAATCMDSYGIISRFQKASKRFESEDAESFSVRLSRDVILCASTATLNTIGKKQEEKVRRERERGEFYKIKTNGDGGENKSSEKDWFPFLIS